MAKKDTKPSVEHEDVVVPFSRLHFDPINPRNQPEPDEEKIRSLFAVQSETVVLATHMAKHGLNPLDLLGVVEHPDLPEHYVVREGNRRLAAMQLLRDPERAPSPADRKVFQRIATGGRPIPDRLKVVLFHERLKARVWMSVKHEGPQGGLGALLETSLTPDIVIGHDVTHDHAPHQALGLLAPPAVV